MKEKEQITQLKAELESVKKEFSQRISSLEKTITQFSSDEPDAEEQSSSLSANIPQTTITPKISEPNTVLESAADKAIKHKINVLSILWSWLSNFQPFMAIYTPILTTYKKYQTRGQGPIFLFIIIGITLMVFGFGYLTQLLVSELGAQSKTLALFVVAMAITFAGIKLNGGRKYADFGSSIIGLGLVLNFTTLYVAGSFYQLMPNWLNLLGYVLIGYVGYWVSARFDTKLVSVISLLGAGLAPFVISLTAVTGATFMVGLGMIILAGLRHSYKQNWHWYGYLAAVVAFACVESMQQQQISNWVIAFPTEAYYLIFMAYALLSIARQKTLTKPNLVMLAAILAASSSQLFFALQNEVYLSLMAILNLVISLVVILKVGRQNKLLFTLCTAIASVWATIAIVFWLSADFWSVGLGVEGLFLLYFAINEKLRSIRMEAQGLLLVALLIAIASVIPYFPAPALLSVKGWAICLVIGVLLFLWRKILSTAKQLSEWEDRLFSGLYPAESVWMTILALAGLWVHFGVWAIVGVPMVQILLLYRSRLAHCKWSEILVVLSAVMTIFIWFQGVTESDSLRFSKLPLYGKIALVTLFAELWLLAEFYRRFMPSGQLAGVAEKLRVLFYALLPIVALPSITRIYPEWLASALWVSTIVSYFISTRVRLTKLRFETLCLATIASFISLISFLLFANSDFWPAMLSLILGNLLTGYFLYRQSKMHCAKLESKIAALFLYFLPVSLGAIAMHAFNLQLGLIVATLTVFSIAQIHSLYAVRKHQSILVNFLFASLAASWVLVVSSGSTIDSIYLMVSFLVLSCSFVPSLPSSKIFRSKMAAFLSFLTQFNLMLMVSYTLLLIQWQWDILITPIIIIHGSLLLFLSQEDKKLAKLALTMIMASLAKLGLLDVTVAELWQKVVLMIGIGVFMLLAAFFYQRKYNTTQGEDNPI